ncbi:MAG: RNA polymerase sigma factor [Chloroflexi bacterium]|nr:RNA polymerase sigma factor [Chloroflexota bacterium]
MAAETLTGGSGAAVIRTMALEIGGPAGRTAEAAVPRLAEAAAVQLAGRPLGGLVDHRWDERELVRRCAEGSASAYGEVIRTHRPRLYLMAYHLTGARGTAEDVVEQAFVVAFRSLERSDPRPSLELWLNTIVLRTASRTVAHRDGAAATLPSADLAGALVELPFKYRVAVVLRHIVGLPSAEAARELDLSLEAFGRHLLHGTWLIQTAMADRLGPADSDDLEIAPPHDETGIRSKVNG